MTLDDLASPQYRALLNRDHGENPNWGTTGAKYAPHIARMAHDWRCESILDYGAGKGRLATALGRLVTEYDPGIEELATLPQPHDMVVSTDVLEHVEPDRVEAVLRHLVSLTRTTGFHAIATCKAQHRLPDGRNAHLSIHPAGWWRERLIDAGFDVIAVRMSFNAPRHEEVVACFEVWPASGPNG